MKKKILYLGNFELPDKNAAAQRVINVSKILKKLKFEIVLIGVTKNEEHFKNKKIFKEEKFEYFEKKYPKSLLEWLKQLSSIKKEKKIISNLESLEAIVCYNYPAIALLKLKYYCKKRNIKIIGDITEWYEPAKKNFLYNFFKNLDTSLRMKYVNKKLDGLICISKFLQEYYSKNITLYLPGMVDKNDKKWKMVGSYLKNEIPTFIFIGNPGERCEKERLDWLIKAVCSLNEEGKKCKLNIVGVTEKEFEKNYKELKLSKYCEEEIIKFIGKIPHIEALIHLKKADFSVIPREIKINTNAGFPTKLGESFSCGTPVIATKTGDIEKFLIEGKNGFLIEEVSYNGLLKKLDELLNNKLLDYNFFHKWTIENNQLDISKYEDSTQNFLKELEI